jgi:hypothetical protein
MRTMGEPMGYRSANRALLFTLALAAAACGSQGSDGSRDESSDESEAEMGDAGSSGDVAGEARDQSDDTGNQGSEPLADDVRDDSETDPRQSSNDAVDAGDPPVTSSDPDASAPAARDDDNDGRDAGAPVVDPDVPPMSDDDAAVGDPADDDATDADAGSERPLVDDCPCHPGLSCAGGGVAAVCGFTFDPRPGQVCSRDGWCSFSHPAGINDLLSVFAISATDIWAVGDAGTLLHYDGVRWSGQTGLALALETERSVGDNADSFNSVWASAPDDIWIAGTAGLLRGDGRQFSVVDIELSNSSSYSGVWGTGAANVWVGGNGGAGQDALYHWDGQAWERFEFDDPSISLRDVWVGAPDDVWVATDRGVYHFDGAELVDSGLSGTSGVWGSQETGVWAWSGGSSLSQLVGSTWISVGPDDGGFYGAAWGTSQNSMWIGGGSDGQPGVFFYDGEWTHHETLLSVNDIHGVRSTIVGVGAYGFVTQLSAESAVEDPAFLFDHGLVTLSDIDGSSASDVWIVGRGAPRGTDSRGGLALHYDGSDLAVHEQSGTYWSSVSTVPGGQPWIGKDDFTGNSPGEAWLFDGAEFVQDGTAPVVPYARLAALSPDEVFAITREDAAIYRFDGDGWAETSHLLSGSDERLREIWASPNGQLWVVGTSGITMRYEEGTWSPHTTSNADEMLVAVGGDAAGAVWTVGENGSVHTWQEGAWQLVHELGEPAATMTVCPDGGVWIALSNRPEVVHFDGDQWQSTQTGTLQRLVSSQLWCAPNDDMWLTTMGAVLRLEAP